VDRPKEAIERMRDWGPSISGCPEAILAYLDWLEGKHVVEWPKELT